MIDIKTGAISFPMWSESICPSTTRDEFLESTLSNNSIINVKNEPHCSWRLKPIEWNGKKWYITAYFHGNHLNMIHIGAGSPEFGTSWDDWSEEKEQFRKQYHEQILKEELGPPPYDFTWGIVKSIYDSKGGASSIIIQPKTEEIPTKTFILGSAYVARAGDS